MVFYKVGVGRIAAWGARPRIHEGHTRGSGRVMMLSLLPESPYISILVSSSVLSYCIFSTGDQRKLENRIAITALAGCTRCDTPKCVPL
jgi:hypothetical protein